MSIGDPASSCGPAGLSSALPAARAQEALQLLKAGLPAQAETVCLEVLASHPRYFHALHLAGIAALQRRDFVLAGERLQAAVEADPAQPAAHSNLAIALLAQGRSLAALESCARALQLEPRMPGVWSNRGDALRAQGRPQEALESYERALALAPGLIEAHVGRAGALWDLDRLDEALRGFEQVLSLDPRHADALSNRGCVLHELGRPLEALASFEAALTCVPDFPEAMSGRGTVLQSLGRFPEALECFNRALALRPGWAAAHNNRGNVLRVMEAFDAAIADFDAAIASQPDSANAYRNRGVVHGELGEIDEAIADFTRAITLQPSLAGAHQNLAQMLLLKADYAKGWQAYEWRRKVKHTGLYRKSQGRRAPLWLGDADLAGKSILLYEEQGLGDTIQFSRYASVVADLGARVLLEVQGPLKDLMGSLRGVAQVLESGEAAPAHDVQCPLMSLPLACRTTVETIPAEVPYLRPDPDKVMQWQRRLGARAKPRIGLVWSGGHRPHRPELWAINSRRNIPLAQLLEVCDPRFDFYSLQKGEAAEQELADARSSSAAPLIDHTSLLRDFSETAALVQLMDLVICVDTSVAHLAGALGKPVWLLNRFDTCWRWFLDRTDSPWYPTLRVYRQERQGDWPGVIKQVKRDLASFLSPGAS